MNILSVFTNDPICYGMNFYDISQDSDILVMEDKDNYLHKQYSSNSRRFMTFPVYLNNAVDITWKNSDFVMNCLEITEALENMVLMASDVNNDCEQYSSIDKAFEEIAKINGKKDYYCETLLDNSLDFPFEYAFVSKDFMDCGKYEEKIIRSGFNWLDKNKVIFLKQDVLGIVTLFCVDKSKGYGKNRQHISKVESFGAAILLNSVKNARIK
jgi:hypothetical protein